MGDVERLQASSSNLIEKAFIEYKGNNNTEFDDSPSYSYSDVLVKQQNDSETEQEISDKIDSTEDEEKPVNFFESDDGET